MRILLAHNYYQTAGGEDVVFHAETELLRKAGHNVLTLTIHNSQISSMNPASLAWNTIWSSASYRQVAELIRKDQPDVAHFHNTFPLLSPSVYYACHALRIPVVQTLHNYRLSCPSAIFQRDGKVCEACLGKRFAFPGVLHACYRGSRSQTAVAATMLAVHSLRHTWQEQVDAYIALTEFSRSKMIQAGLPPQAIYVKPNFVEASHVEPRRDGSYALFIGRLAPEKGVDTLLRAWSGVTSIPLKVLGDGPLRPLVEGHAMQNPAIEYLGQQDRTSVLDHLCHARFLIFPSEWYESFPMAIVESFSAGTPVLTSRLGAQAELVRDGGTGVHFTPGDPHDLSAKVRWLWAHPEETTQMEKNARLEYEQKYTAEKNLELLLHIYESAMSRRRQ